MIVVGATGLGLAHLNTERTVLWVGEDGDLPGLEPEMPENAGGFSMEIAVGSLFRVRVPVQRHGGILRGSSQQLAPPWWEMEEVMSLGSLGRGKQQLPGMREPGGKPGVLFLAPDVPDRRQHREAYGGLHLALSVKGGEEPPGGVGGGSAQHAEETEPSV